VELPSNPAVAMTTDGYRLPRNYEWEIAARSDNSQYYTIFNTGNSISTDQANYDGTLAYGLGDPSPVAGQFRGHTMPVDSFLSNLWGFYNMHGNVWEWVHASFWSEDWWVKGGGWNSGRDHIRTIHRGWYNNDVTIRSSTAGFRIARNNKDNRKY
jgi:formylglycine-generating enzyme required for sulfatase activity